MKNKKQSFFRSINNQELNEAFKLIRTNLYFLSEEKKVRIILVTSSIPEEGKSIVASNYAKSLAIAGEKVLLIDCNVKSPKIHENFNLFFDKGLESALYEEYKIEDIVLRDVEKNLDILPIKNVVDNTIEYFLEKKIKLILQEVKEKYNIIILDTQSLIISSDAALLSKYCDGVVYVVGYNQVTRRELEFGKTILDNAKANIYGFIMNKIDRNGLLYDAYGCYNKNYYAKKMSFFERIYKVLK